VLKRWIESPPNMFTPSGPLGGRVVTTSTS